MASTMDWMVSMTVRLLWLVCMWDTPCDSRRARLPLFVGVTLRPYPCNEGTTEAERRG